MDEDKLRYRRRSYMSDTVLAGSLLAQRNRVFREVFEFPLYIGCS